MPLPKRRLNLVRKSQKRHYSSPVTHEIGFRKIGIQHFTLEHLIDLGMTLPDRYRYPRLDDSGLFEGDFRKRVTEHVAMVQTYICNDTEYRGDDVRAVQTASETGFKHHDIRSGIREPAQSNRCGYLEE